MDSEKVMYVDKLSDVASSDEEEDESSKISIKKPEALQPDDSVNIIEEQNEIISDDIVGEEGAEPNIWVAEYIGNSENTTQVANKLN
jgi:hypothetical protein